MSEEAQAFAPIERFDIGAGLEVWKVKVDDLREQDDNARAMSPQAFIQLKETVKRTNRLESLPLCAWKDDKIEIISGHHRTRAARQAGLEHCWILIDVTDMPRDFIKAKQLAHNSIQGEDNPDLLAKIFGDISDTDARIEAFMEPDLSAMATDVKLVTSDLDIMLETRPVTLLFLKPQAKLLKEALEALSDVEDEVFLANREEYETLVDTIGKVGEAFTIHSTPTIFAKMSEIVLEVVAERQAEEAAAAAAQEELLNASNG